MNITDPGDTFNVTVESNLPAGYTFENSESIYTLSITLSSIIEDLTITVIARDSLGATSAIQPQVNTFLNYWLFYSYNESGNYFNAYFY